jgi:broad specificity phosphatase PhoE
MDTLSRNAKKGESYKILFLARHGQGTHNVAEEKYGTRAWDCYYSALNGSDGLTWSDAPLTPLGITQAQAVNTLWKEELQNGIPVPQSWYISPLTRAIQTADTTFSDLGIAYEPLVKELLREALGIHTCDRRSTKSRIAESFPHVRFERGFTEDDELWQADYREPSSARDYRLATLLDEVFTMDAGEWISFTSHSGAIGSLLRVLGHRVCFSGSNPFY